MKSESRTSPRRVLFVVTGLGWGGAESQVIELALRMRNKGFQAAVATLLTVAERRNTLDAEGIPVYSLGMRRGVPDPRAIWRLAKVVRRFRPDVVHAHMVHANLLSRVTRLIAPMPVHISSSHNVNEGAAWRVTAYRLTDRLTDLTTNVSEAAVKRSVELGSAPASRIRRMSNGVDLQRFQMREPSRSDTRRALGIGDRFLWLAVGSLEKQKAYPNLFRAASRVKGHRAKPLVLVVGAGPLREELEAMVFQMGLKDCIRFLGLRDDVERLMGAADGYVMSSAWEGLPVVLLEAAASGLPIVATDVGGNREIVSDGGTGMLVPPKDAEALAGAMCRLMDMSTSGRHALGSEAARHVRSRFGIEEVVDRWIEIYDSLRRREAGFSGTPT